MRDQLEAAIDANPDDVDAYLVYADWLQAQGDPRGELVVLQHEGKETAAEALIERAALLGGFHDFVARTPPDASNRRLFVVEWKLGFIETAHIGWETSRGMSIDEALESFAEFLALPSARFLRSLHLGPVVAGDRLRFEPWLEMLAERGPPTLRALTAGKIAHWDVTTTSAGPFGSVLAAFPRLQTLTARAGEITFGGPFEHAELRSLAVQTSGIGNALVDIALSRLPKLERLELWLGLPRDGGPADPAALDPILDGERWPALRHLGLVNASYTNVIARHLVGSQILPRLRTLDLSMGTLTDDGLRAMAAARDAFAHLDELDLDDNALTEDVRLLAEGLAKRVRFGTQDLDRVVDRDLEDRYTSVGE